MAEPEQPDFVNVTELQRREDLQNYYILADDLGQGMFGVTCMATPVNDPTRRVAVKIQDRGHPDLLIPPHIIAEEILRLYKEILIINRILPKHPNILEIKDLLVSPDQSFIVTELCERKMADFYPVCDEASARRAFAQLVDAVHVCHEHGVLHNDIKVDNILFLDAQFMQVKLIDFGVAEYSPQWARKRHNEFDHNKWFAQEEIWDREPHPDIDVRALGTVLHEMICGQYVPDIMTGMVEKMQTIYRPRWNRFSPAALDLLLHIGISPYGPRGDEESLTLDQVRQHPWLTGLPFINIQPAINLEEELRALQWDLKVLRRLLKGWMVLPICIMDNPPVPTGYQVTGAFNRDDQQNSVYSVTSVSYPDVQRVMKVIHGRMPGTPPGIVDVPPINIYVDMLITLRILPRHENFVKIRNVYVSTNTVALVKELLNNNSLEDLFPVANDVTSRWVFKQIANAVRHLHHHGVVHTDLHPRHIMFTDDFQHCKIINCSHALYVQHMVRLSHENFEPERYFTPVLLQSMAAQADAQDDISALGRILHAMMCNKWEEDATQIGLFWRVDLVPDQEEFHPLAFNLLGRIGPEPFGLAHEYRQISIDEICEHPWLLLTEDGEP
ncbi:hypothetical protein R1flu_026691 [Riccia fluitans]|uniref:Protein kinase domain-containing protein n=1 Tax=Riccia fluitans TaxID=41844 RepID=A0ABD1XHE4_9MARC